MLVDTHAHLDFPEFIHDIPGVLSRAREADVTKIITIGIDLQSTPTGYPAGPGIRTYPCRGGHPSPWRPGNSAGTTLIS